jgi:hypothetical protein
MIEAQALAQIFNQLFRKIDEDMYAIMRDVPSIVFVKYILNAFTDFKPDSVRLMILDLLALVGSGYSTKTHCPRPVNANELRPLPRTTQLLLSLSLAMLRQIIYQQKLT